MYWSLTDIWLEYTLMVVELIEHSVVSWRLADHHIDIIGLVTFQGLSSLCSNCQQMTHLNMTASTMQISRVVERVTKFRPGCFKIGSEKQSMSAGRGI